MPAEDNKDKTKAIQSAKKDQIMLAMFMLEDYPNIINCQETTYLYNGKCYDLITDKDLDKMFLKFCTKYGVTSAWRNISSVIRAFLVLPNINIVEEMNDYDNLMCLNNGVLNIHTKELIPHSPKYYFDSVINVDYDSKQESCPNFMGYLQHTFNGDKDTIANIVRIGGYLLDTSNKAGRMFMFDGEGGCLDRETYIPYDIRSDKKSINSKGGSIEMLYNRFHDEQVPGGKGGYHLRTTKDVDYYVSSINENNSIFKNRIVDVVKTGNKKCYELISKAGEKIIATKDHKFYNGYSYVALENMKVNDTIYINNNTHYKNIKTEKRVCYKEFFVKYHPLSSQKIVNKCKYYRIKVCNATIEADMNNIGLKDYIKALNIWPKKRIEKEFIFIKKGFVVHHINEDKRDDNRENLVLMIAYDHGKLHADKNYNKLRSLVTPDKVKSIKVVGERNTYDIKCLYPYNNYIANNIVVHNSGKSTLLDTFSMFFTESIDHRNQITSLSLENLASGGFDKEILINSRFNQCAETKKGYIDAEEIKKIITGDIIKVDRKFKVSINFRPKTKIIVACNGLPKFNDTSNGIYRRLCIIPFTNQYWPADKVAGIKDAELRKIYPLDIDLMDKIKEEKTAILNLFIGGLIDLRKNKYQFMDSDVSQKAIQAFKRDSDVAREFLEDTYEVDVKSEVSLKEIFSNFRYWYRDNVQDSGVIKFRTAEMGKRIREVFGVDVSNRKNVFVEENRQYEKLSFYPLKKKIIVSDTGPEPMTHEEVKEQGALKF